LPTAEIENYPRFKIDALKTTPAPHKRSARPAQIGNDALWSRRGRPGVRYTVQNRRSRRNVR
jgi:hypothetical protein